MIFIFFNPKNINNKKKKKKKSKIKKIKNLKTIKKKLIFLLNKFKKNLKKKN